MAFHNDITLKKINDGRYRATIHENYWVIAGPNGGYLAALLANAGDLHINEPERQLRSFTTYFLSPPKSGEATITVKTEKKGRSVDFLSLELRQDGNVLLLATGAWGLSGDDLTTPKLTKPEVPHPSKCPPIQRFHPHHTRLHEQWEIRSLNIEESNASFEQLGPEPDLSWWIRPARHTPLSSPLIVALSDALPPPIFASSNKLNHVPTVDLTVHLRADLHSTDWSHESWVLAQFVTRHASNGFLEEDGLLWLNDGTLLGMSRQLSVAK